MGNVTRCVNVKVMSSSSFFQSLIKTETRKFPRPFFSFCQPAIKIRSLTMTEVTLSGWHCACAIRLTCPCYPALLAFSGVKNSFNQHLFSCFFFFFFCSNRQILDLVNSHTDEAVLLSHHACTPMHYLCLSLFMTPMDRCRLIISLV